MTAMKILAVDDDEIVLRLLSEVLRRAGHSEVTTCNSADEALRTIGKGPAKFDCILLDIQMPGMDGIDLCRAIRTMPGHKTTPILMLTAMSEKTFVDRAFAAGATDYLTKPFDATEVAVRLGLARQLVAERKMLSDNAEIIDSFIEVLDETTRHDLIQAIDLGKMEGLLSYPAFENYLYQSGRSVLFLATVFAVKIKNVENWHRKLPPLEFKVLLRQSAEAIISRLQASEVFLTYRGDGEFVGVVPRAGAQALKAIGDTIEIDVNESEGKFGASLPRSLKLVFGSPVANRIPTRGGILKNIWTALERVREKVEPASTQPPVLNLFDEPSHPYRGPSVSNEAQRGALKAEFEDFLEDKLRNEVGEHPARKKPTAAAEISLFRFQRRTRALAGGKDKELFGGSNTKVRSPKAPKEKTLLAPPGTVGAPLKAET